MTRLLFGSLALVLLFARSAHADVVTDWNATALSVLRAGAVGANPAARGLAIVSLAVNDAVVSISHEHDAYLEELSYEGSASVEAAAAAAASRALVALFPAQASIVDAARSASLAAIADGAAKTTGISVGEAAANAILALRADDGAAGSGSYPGGTAVGQWRPTPPGLQAAAQPFWVDVDPFVVESADQFRPSPAPALNSLAYALSYLDVRLLGATDSTLRTAEQAEIAKFWVPASAIQWNDIARVVAIARKLSLSQNARLFGLLNAALADSRIAAWDAKYAYGSWRPITAIVGAASDGNPFTAPDAAWAPLISTPNHPDYVSGHSTSGAAAAFVLTVIFGDRQTFDLTSDNLPGVTRSFRSFSQAAHENGRSRIYGGIHFEFANQAGQALGRAVARHVVLHALRPR